MESNRQDRQEEFKMQFLKERLQSRISEDGEDGAPEWLANLATLAAHFV